VWIIALPALTDRTYWEAILAAGSDGVVPSATADTSLLPAIQQAGVEIWRSWED
jgi:hypothetical protein